MSIKNKTIKGVQWTAISSVAKILLYLLQMAILTHYLSHSQIGLVSLTIAITGILTIYMEAGFSNAIIHKQDITHNQLSSLYWLNIISGVLIFLFMVVLSPLIAKLYNEPILKNLIFINSFCVLFLSFGLQYKIVFQKHLNFKLISIIEVVTSLIALLATVNLIKYNFGIYTLVYSNLLMYFLLSASFIITGIKFHKPSFVFELKEIKFFINYGLNQIFCSNINYLNNQLDTIIIGKILGAEVLGLYSVAKLVAVRPYEFINPIVTRVTFPLMSQIQDNPEQLKSVYLKVVNYLSALNSIVYIFIAIYADVLIKIIFGEEWLKATTILRILCIAGFCKAIINPVSSLIYAKGRVDMATKWNFLLLITLILFIFGGSLYGITGISISLSLMFAMQFFVSYYTVIKNLINITLNDYFINVLVPLFITLAAAVIMILIIFFLKSFNLLALIFSFLTGLIIIFFLSIKLNKAFVDIIFEILKIKPINSL